MASNFLTALLLWACCIVSMVHTASASAMSTTISRDLAFNDNVTHIALPLNKRDACDGTSGSWPILYHNYTNADCTPIIPMSYDGKYCDFMTLPDQPYRHCFAFCQQTTFFEYAQESPFPNSYCNAPMTCSLSFSKSSSWNWGISFSPKIGKAIKVGISGSYGESYGTTSGHSWSFTPKDGQCGYFTFVPIKKTTCGVYTEANVERYWWSDIWFCGEEKRSTPMCAPESWQPSTAKEGPEGTVIFVNTDCDTRRPLDDDQQDVIYRHPGVPLDRGLSTAMINSWTNNTCLVTSSTTPVAAGFVAYTVEIFGTGMIFGEVGLNGSTLVSSIEFACGANTTAPYSFAWFETNGTMIDGPLSQISQGDGSSLYNMTTLPIEGANFGTIMTLAIPSGNSTRCIATALQQAGSLIDEHEQCIPNSGQ